MDSSKCSMIPRRVVIAVMAFFGTVTTLIMRSFISIVITEIVTPLNNTGKTNGSFTCPADSLSVKSNITSNMNGTRYDWTQEQQGWIFSALSVGYLMTHLPGAILAQRYGGKWTLSLGILAITICTAATPLAVKYGELGALIVSRILIGLFAGPSFPALTVLLSAWIPVKERGKLGVLVLGGGQIGNILSFYISGFILSYWSWPIVFYFWSAVSSIWFILFTLFVYDDPASHPSISKKELEYLKKEIGQLKRGKDLPPTPWKAMLTSKPVIAIIIAEICGDWVHYIIWSDFPKYMREVIGFSIHSVGIFSALPYLSKWIVSVLSGFLTDYVIKRKFVTTNQARKINTAFSSIVPATFILAASYAGCDRVVVVIYFVIAIAAMGTYYPGIRLNILDLSPNYSGSIMALANGAGAVAGVISPTFAGMMTPDSSLEQWRFVFWVSFVVYTFRAIIFSILGSAEVQPWNEPKNVDASEFHKLTEIGANYTEDNQNEDKK